MVRAFADGEDAQLLAMGDFIVGSGLKDACRQRKWKMIARAYNGQDYAKNNYDQKLEAAYDESGEEKAAGFVYPDDDVLEMGEKGSDIKALQVQLTALGFHVHADGDFGIETRDAVRAAQFRLGLPVDGKVGAETRRALATAAPKAPPATPVTQVIANSATAKSALAQIVIGATATAVAGANATVATVPPTPVAPPTLTDIEGAIKLSEQGLGLASKILAIGVDKLLIAVGAGALIFGVITLYRRVQAHYARKIG
jgi:peptidoglycan hydrolase-like protein with peptidoglycan-binding domain